ncbi:MAG: hypothetical protein LBG89_03610, partial [Rickettsiales bacterium]|nr:hypothetical protein [Rickettsiales bacterium]
MIKAREKFLLGIVTAMFAAGGAFAADVPAPQGRVARGLVAGTANAPQVQQATGRSRMPMMAARPAEAVQEEEATTTAEADAGFGAALDKRFEGEAVDERALAKERAAAREEYDMAENAFLRGISAAGKSKCETELRVCVANDCGDDMQKCMGDGDGIWSARFQKCRATTSCNGAEIGVYGDIIKEDMRVDSKLHTMQMIIEGNNMYSRCLQDNCATTQGTPMEGMVGFNACVTQVRINQALDACKHIYEKFRPYDSGLQARFTTMMGQLRVEKEKRIAELQKELDEMMPQMRQECKAAGAVFDDRSGECVFTAFLSVEHDGRRFTAASKKLVPGSEYQCTDKWFGIDITTFMKNAIGLTIEQKSASAAFMGAGLGVAASVGTSMIADKLGDKGEVLDKAKALAPAAAP